MVERRLEILRRIELVLEQELDGTLACLPTTSHGRIMTSEAPPVEGAKRGLPTSTRGAQGLDGRFHTVRLGIEAPARQPVPPRMQGEALRYVAEASASDWDALDPPSPAPKGHRPVRHDHTP